MFWAGVLTKYRKIFSSLARKPNCLYFVNYCLIIHVYAEIDKYVAIDGRRQIYGGRYRFRQKMRERGKKMEKVQVEKGEGLGRGGKEEGKRGRNQKGKRKVVKGGREKEEGNREEEEREEEEGRGRRGGPG